MNNNSQYLAYLADRIQKVTEALYRVTDLLNDREPLKWESRDKAINIFNRFVSLQNNSVLEKNFQLEKIGNHVSELVILISIFSENKSALGNNFRILKNEYESIKKNITEECREKDVVEILLGLPAPAKLSGMPQTRDLNTNGHSNGQPNRHNNGNGQSKLKKSDTVQAQNFSQKSDKRKGRILDILKAKKEISVSELSSLFKDFSEKTIQRDLVEMAERGIVKKEGDKRWRKYVLVS